jgi:two-component system LytT family response regulator
MIRTVIIDDEPLIRQDLLHLMEKHVDVLVVANCGSIAEALPVIRATQPQLVLLDIQLEDGDAFQLLQHFLPLSFSVIFITAYNEHAINAIKIGALDYLLKPVSETDLALALQKVTPLPENRVAMQQQLDITHAWLKKKASTERIVLRTQDYLKIVSFREIIYCRGDAGYTYFFLTENRKIVVSGTIKEYAALLPPDLFIRSHQSYLVNYLFIDTFIKDGLLVLKTGEEIPVSIRRKEMVIQFLTGQ